MVGVEGCTFCVEVEGGDMLPVGGGCGRGNTEKENSGLWDVILLGEDLTSDFPDFFNGCDAGKGSSATLATFFSCTVEDEMHLNCRQLNQKCA